MARYQQRVLVHDETKATDITGFSLAAIGVFGFALNIIKIIATMNFSTFLYGPLFFALIILGTLIIGAGRLFHTARVVNKPVSEEDELEKRLRADQVEKDVAFELDRLKGLGYHVIHNKDVFVPGDKAQIDHIVVGENGVTHIETKGWTGTIAFKLNGEVERSHGDYSENPTGQVLRHEIVLKNLLHRHGFGDVDVTGVICFGNPRATLQGSSDRYATVKKDYLTHTILERRAHRTLSTSEIHQVSQIILNSSRDSEMKVIPDDSRHGGNRARRLFKSRGVPIYIALVQRGNRRYPVIALCIAVAFIWLVGGAVQSSRFTGTRPVSIQEPASSSTSTVFQADNSVSVNKGHDESRYFSEVSRGQGVVTFKVVDVYSSGGKTTFSIQASNNDTSAAFGPEEIDFPMSELSVVDRDGHVQQMSELDASQYKVRVPYQQTATVGPFQVNVTLSKIAEIRTDFWAQDPQVPSGLITFQRH